MIDRKKDSRALELLRLETALLKKQERLERERRTRRGDWLPVVGGCIAGVIILATFELFAYWFNASPFRH